MPDTPDPDPVTKVIGALRTAVDDLARLVEHPAVKNVLGGLLSALGREDAPAAAAQSPAGADAGAAQARAASTTKPAASKASPPAATAPAKTKPAARAPSEAKAKAASGGAASKPASPAAKLAPAAKAGGRREDLLAAIEQHPGISIAGAAKQIGVAPGGLYPIARKLEADGLIRKDGTGWLSAAPAS